MFEDMTNLQLIDLAGNYLVVLEVSSFVMLPRLESVNFEGNFFKCDKPIMFLISWLKKHRIEYKATNCGEYS